MSLAASALPVESQPAFLGVQHSLTGKLWRDRLDARGAARALAIVQRHQLPEMLARVLAGRDVDIDAVPDYLDPTIRKLMPDPYTVTDMEPAAKRIADAATRGEKVAIFGDYDVDGATSAALLAWHLRHCGLDPLIHIPDRLFGMASLSMSSPVWLMSTRRAPQAQDLIVSSMEGKGSRASSALARADGVPLWLPGQRAMTRE